MQTDGQSATRCPAGASARDESLPGAYLVIAWAVAQSSLPAPQDGRGAGELAGQRPVRWDAPGNAKAATPPKHGRVR
ncbi:MAG: hypothetical protein ORN29_03955, partial [Rhodoferax sp.]|nr:hypothetical protein [Rhodoferax sp.]